MFLLNVEELLPLVNAKRQYVLQKYNLVFVSKNPNLNDVIIELTTSIQPSYILIRNCLNSIKIKTSLNDLLNNVI